MLRIDSKPYDQGLLWLVLVFAVAGALLAYDFDWAMGVLVMGSLLLNVYVLLRHRVIVDESRSGVHCLSCKFDLRGSIQGARAFCPECGTEIPERWLAQDSS